MFNVVMPFVIHKDVYIVDLPEQKCDDIPVIDASTIFINDIEVIEVEIETPPAEEQEESTASMLPEFSYSKDWDVEDSYLLAKIAMAEAEGENIQTKTLIIMTILNRVHHEDFPNTIRDVIYQKKNGVYQFSPLGCDRWDNIEPNEDCYEALRIVQESQYDYSGGALYFESCEGESWHSRNLEFLYQSQHMKFYK